MQVVQSVCTVPRIWTAGSPVSLGKLLRLCCLTFGEQLAMLVPGVKSTAKSYRWPSPKGLKSLPLKSVPCPACSGEAGQGS